MGKTAKTAKKTIRHNCMKITWHIEKRKVATLKIYPRNPRTITKDHFERLKKKITERGFHDVLKIDVDGTILSGNQRKRALVELGVETVDCIVPDRPLTEAECQAIVVESNVQEGEFDMDMLANVFDEQVLKDVGVDFGNNMPPDEIEPEELKEQMIKIQMKIPVGKFEIMRVAIETICNENGINYEIK